MLQEDMRSSTGGVGARVASYLHIIKDLYKWKSCRGIQNFLNVAHSEAERNDHDEAHGPINARCPHNRLGKHQGRISDFLGHVYRRISPDQRIDRGEKTDKEAQAFCVPSAEIQEVSEDMGWAVQWCKHPEGYKDAKEPQYVDAEDHAFDHRETFCQNGVEYYAECRYSDDKESTMPPLEVILLVGKDEQTLYHSPSKKCQGCQANLPAQYCDPS